MSHMHLIDLLDAAKTNAEFAKQSFLVYLISLAKAEAMTTTVESSAPFVAASGARPLLRLVTNPEASP